MLPGTIIIKIMCVHQLYCRAKAPAPIKIISPITWFGTILNSLSEVDPEKAYGKVFGHQARDPVIQCRFI